VGDIADVDAIQALNAELAGGTYESAAVTVAPPEAPKPPTKADLARAEIDKVLADLTVPATVKAGLTALRP
jgi:hypothetical protein